MRRALGLDGNLDSETVRASLDFLTTNKNAKYVMDRKSIAGLRLSAPDVGWSFGSGPGVEGAGESLMMALTGRPTLGELAGDGLDTLADRLAS